MKKILLFIIALYTLVTMDAWSQNKDMIVRISEIEVYPQYLTEYLRFAKHVGETSVREEAGVIAIFPMQQQRDSCQIRIVEIYATQEAYQYHIQTSHFQTYKQGTLHMVKSLDLVDMDPMNVAAMPDIFRKMTGVRSNGVKLVTPYDFKSLLATDHQAYLLDARTVEEYAEVHIQGAHQLNWFEQETFKEEAKSLDPALTIYVYCRKGGRSNEVADYLAGQGYKVVDLAGGITAWQESGFEVVTE